MQRLSTRIPQQPEVVQQADHVGDDGDSRHHPEQVEEELATADFDPKTLAWVRFLIGCLDSDGFLAPSDDELLHNRLVGRRAPGWLLQRADDGRWIDDRALRGRVGVLVFFELGCAECVAALDDLGQWARRQPASALTLFAVAGAELPVGRAFLGRTPLLVSLLLDPTRRPGGLGDVIRQFVISPGGMTVVVTDPRGVVRHAALLDAAELSERDALDDVTAAAARAMRRR